MRHPTSYVVIIAATGALLAGCASTPRRNPELTQARNAVETLSNQPRAMEAAGPDLREARTELGAAETALHNGKSKEEVSQLSYLALRHAQAGQARVDAAQSQAEVAQATQERQQLLLEAEKHHAMTAQQQAQSAQQQAQSAQQQVQAAHTQAQQARMQAQQAQQQAQQAQQQLASERQQYDQLQKDQLDTQQTDQGMVVTLSNVLFSTGKATLQPGAHLVLDRLGSYLKAHPKQRVMIEGNTDSTGSADLNEKLSAARAHAVAQSLQLRGVSPDQYQTIGLGEAYPVASNDTVAGRQQNRRVDVVFSSPSGKFSEAALSRQGQGAIRR